MTILQAQTKEGTPAQIRLHPQCSISSMSFSRCLSTLACMENLVPRLSAALGASGFEDHYGRSAENATHRRSKCSLCGYIRKELQKLLHRRHLLGNSAMFFYVPGSHAYLMVKPTGDARVKSTQKLRAHDFENKVLNIKRQTPTRALGAALCSPGASAPLNSSRVRCSCRASHK